jgi:hypothetical protein
MSGEVGKYSIIGWRSYKLPRVCRSSLAAESQACATAIDELSIVKLIFGLLRDPNLNIKDDDAARGMRSAVIIDARALYDAIHKETFQSSLDKRVAMETLVIRDGPTQVTGATATLEEAKALVEFKIAQNVKTLEDRLDTEIILTPVFVFMILLIMIYVTVKVFCAKNVRYEIEETLYVEAETQTETGAATNIATISYMMSRCSWEATLVL